MIINRYKIRPGTPIVKYNLGTHRDVFNMALNGRQLPDDKCSSQRVGKDFESFFGGFTLDGAIEAAKQGWDVGRKRLDDILVRMHIDDMAEGEIVECFSDVSGEVADVGAYLAGNPESMVSIRRTPQLEFRKHIRLQANIGVTCTYTPEQMFYRGAVAAGLVYLFEMNGWSVELTCSFSGWGMDQKRLWVWYWNAKPLEYALNMDLMAMLLCSAASFRRIGFAIMESMAPNHHPELGVPSFYTFPQDYVLPDHDFYIGDLKINDLETAKQHIINIANEIISNKIKLHADETHIR